MLSSFGGVEKKLKNRQYQQAISDCDIWINKLSAENRDEVIYLCKFKNKRAFAYYFLDNNQLCIEEGLEVLNILKDTIYLCDPDGQLVLSETHHLLGQAYEIDKQPMKAMGEYKLSISLKPTKENENSMKGLFLNLGIPILPKNDPQFSVFLQISNSIDDETQLIKCIQSLNENIPSLITPPLAEKYNSKGCGKLITSILKLHHENIQISTLAMECMRNLHLHGVTDIWANITSLLNVFREFLGNQDLLIKFLDLIQYANENSYEKMVEIGFLPIIIESYELLKNTEYIELVFRILYLSCSTPASIQSITNTDVVESIFVSKSVSSMFLLSRISLIPMHCKKVEEIGAIDWVYDMMANNYDKPMIFTSGSFIILRSLVKLSPDGSTTQLIGKDNAPNEKEITLVSLAFERIAPILAANPKNVEIVTNSFMIFSVAVKILPNKAVEHRLLRLSSIVLMLHMKDQSLINNVISFLYEAADNGLGNDIKTIPQIMQNVLIALNNYKQNSSIIERVVALSIITEHPNRREIVQSASSIISGSKILAKYTPMLKTI